jgi:hypothetical protein
MAGISDLLSSLFSPSSQEGYDQGYVAGNNPTTPLAQAIQAASFSNGTGAPMGYGSASAMPQTPVAQAMQFSNGTGAPMGFGGSAAPTPGVANQTDNQQASTASNLAQFQAMMNPTGSNQVGFQPGQGAPDAPSLSTVPPQLQAALNNQAQNPNYALGQGLLSAGSAMLQGKTFGQGMGAAGDAFGNAYNNTLNNQRDLNTPKVTPLGDGAFSMVQMPGQQPQVVANGDVQNYVMGKTVLAAQIAQARQTAQKNGQIQVNAAKMDQTNATNAATSLMNLQQSGQGLQQAQALTNALKADPDRQRNLQIYSALPAVGQRLAASGATGQDMARAASDYNTLNNAGLDATKFELSGLTGSMTTESFNKALGATPSPSDAPSVWDTYYQRAGQLLQDRTNFYQGVYNRGVNAGNRSVNPAGGNGRAIVPAPQGDAASPGGGVLTAGRPQFGNAMSYIQ